MMSDEFRRCVLLVLGCAGALAVLAACRPVQRTTPGVGQELAITVHLERAEDRAIVSSDGGLVTVDLLSPKGIGGATISWPAGAAPRELQLRLHLGGLEELRLENDGTEVVASVASRPPYTVRAQSSDGQSLSPGDELWPVITLVPADGQPPTIPLQDGYFQVEVPAPLTAGKAQRLSVHWIDFYR